MGVFSQNSPSSRDTTSFGSSLRYPINEKNNFPFSTSGIISPMLLRQPSNVKQSIVYDPVTNRYVFSEKIGELNYRPPSSMSLSEYRRYEAQKSKTDYWREKMMEESGAGPSFMKNLRLGNQTLDKVFGTDIISIVPQGSAELIFGYSISKNENPQLPIRSRKDGSFIFKMKIMMNVTGSIGDKMSVGLNYNTEATFDFENKTKLEYSGKEDEIIKKIEAGDVSFALPGSLITGSQSLFGLKTEMQFGHLTVTSVLSRQRGESQSINVQGGAQLTDFEINVDDYDANRHFFLSHFFRDNYNNWLKSLPYIESQVQIQQVEVWIVNKQSDFTQSRNIVAFMDLGEGYGPDDQQSRLQPNFYADANLIRPSNEKNSPASNTSNAIYGQIGNNDAIRSLSGIDAAISSFSNGQFVHGRDYVKLGSARPLSEREFTVNKELGYISLNSPLRNDEILAVAYTYTYKGEIYSVGELSQSQAAPKTLILKMLKGTTPTPKYPTWDLMMKNVYSIGAYQVNRDGFILNVLYRNDKTGIPINYISEKDPSVISANVNEQILLKVLELDNLDSHNEPNPDGFFDFIEGVTINSRNGRIYFPLLEPFGSDLRNKITDNNPKDIAKNFTADKYVFEELYDSTQTKAKQIAEKNKFMLRGRYQSSSGSEIQLNASNVPKGSVKVTAGGMLLEENKDYTVDYTLGRVRIINQGLLESGTPLRVSLESNSLFNIQTKTLMGAHLDYRFSENFNVGATIMHLSERPLTQKVNMGEEPISNTIWGLNTSYRTQSRLLTTLVDKLPLLETKEPSSVAIDAEFAHLIPRQAKVIGKNGIAYIDDFEAAQTEIDLRSFMNWSIASAPRGQNNLFRYGDENGRRSGFGRAKLAWYIIDPVFYGKTNLKPDGIDVSSNYVKQIDEKEIFPNKNTNVPGMNSISVFNLSYYPNERGPYNYDVSLTSDGQLTDPASRWGGMMREIVSSDFETSNIEFIEFWLMDPFVESEDTINIGGDLYFHLGEISEDILRDSQKSYENGYPADPNDTTFLDFTPWGRVPRGQALTNNFSSDNENQDIGLDGLKDKDDVTGMDEHYYFSGYLDSIPGTAKSIISQDPSADDFEYYLSDNHDSKRHNILERYKNYNGLENNSPSTEQSGGEIASNKATPDVEDINDDNTLNTTETYFQYHISLRPSDLQEVGNNYIVDKREKDDNGVTWYQFRIPIGEPETKVGDIEDFKSIRFMRMVLTHFDQPVYLRFATLDLVRGEWRRYNYDMNETAPSITRQEEGTSFEISAVNIEENAEKTPVNYVLPPGIDRAIDPSQTLPSQLNEQAILLKVKDLKDGDARSVFKNVQIDLRQYKNLKMFIHAEALPGDQSLKDYDVTGFIRIGSDYQNNYYEYELPLIITPGAKYIDGDTSVWPLSNTIDLIMEELVNIKKERNEAMLIDTRISAQSVYVKKEGKNTLKVKGNPNLGNIRQIMIGVRNRGDSYLINSINDGLPKSVELWFNELRLTDFNNKGGWAANGRVQAQLADFGVVNVAGSTSKPGFGGIEEKVEERSHEEINQYDISSNLELGKFFPEKSNVSIPFYVGVSRTIVNPEYYPKDPDIKFKDVLNAAETKEERNSLKLISQDVTSRTSLNLTNVHWNKQLKNWKIFSPGNISASVAYSYIGSHNYGTEYNNIRKYGAGLNYVYNARVKTIQPLQKSKSLKKPIYRIIRDFNFNPYPSRFTFGTQFDRNYQEMKMRNVSNDVILKIDSTINKDFRWDRKYDMVWDLTRAFKIDYSATNSALIDEPTGAYDWFEPDNQHWKDSVWHSIRHFGRNMNFSQNLNANYNVPINKIPFLSWLNVNASYSSTFSWVRGETLRDESIKPLGNTLKNSNTIKLNNSLNLRSLYNNFAYLKRLAAKTSSTKKTNENTRVKSVEFEKQTFFKKDVPKNIVHKLKTEDLEIKVFNADGKEIDVKTTVVNENKIILTANEDVDKATVKIVGKVPLGKNPLVFIGENTVRLLTGFTSANLSWSRTSGTLLPGYLPKTDFLGIDNSNEYNGAPGLLFAFGQQDWDFPYSAIDKGWLTEEKTFTKPVVFTRNDNITIRTTYEPFSGFRVELSAMRSYSEMNEQLYFYGYSEPDSLTNNRFYKSYTVDNRYKGGNYSISIISIATAFEKVSEKNNWESAAFNRMKENRKIISARRYQEMAETNPLYRISVLQPSDDGYFDGYGATSQEVLVPAFLATYTGIDPNQVTFDQFFWTMMPNWRITFDGLSKIDFLQKYLKTITLNHSYKSTYSIGSFGTNVNYFENNNYGVFGSVNNSNSEGGFRGLVRDNQNNFIPEFQFSAVSINEQFSPLFGVDITWNNSLLTRFEIGKSRMLALSLNNNQINESRNNDLTVGAGYRFKEVPFSITTGGNRTQIKSDLNVKFDLTIKDNITIIRPLSEANQELLKEVQTAGSKKFVCSLTADYVISAKFNIQFYCDYTVNTPYVEGNSFLNSETNIGFSLRLSL
jgi:cell surface protein SprA